MARIKGTTVTLYKPTQTGTDPFGAPIETETPETVENVLVGYPESEEITSAISLYGKRIKYTLGIPKGDTHDWVDKKVSWTDAYGIVHTCHTFGAPITGIEENIHPSMPWHMKIYCESYEGYESGT